ncbi:cytochrome P450 [Cladorrhinum sp. PSN332]|nr:cytochrome P450 [Cladorrhinum sp. PSN332]
MLANFISNLVFIIAPSWTTWRIWKFTTLPYIHADDPKEYPYIFPFFGHLFTFFTNSANLMTGAQGKAGFPNPGEKAFGALTRAIVMHQDSPGENLRTLEARFLDYYNRNLRVEVISDGTNSAITCKHVDVSLYGWISQFTARTTERSMFGERLSRNHPDLARNLLIYDEFIWQDLYQCPSILTGKLTAAKKSMLRSMKEHFQTPRSQRPGASWVTETLEDELRAPSVSEDDMAIFMFTLYSANSRKLLFWTLTYLLFNPIFITQLRTETADAFGDSNGGDLIHPDYFSNPNRYPILEAVVLETLRLTGNSVSIRHVKQDTHIGGKLFRAGAKVLVPYQVHRQRSGNLRPFGGGRSICPGRYLSSHSVKMCVAIMVRRFDMEVLGGIEGRKMPERDETKPGFGIVPVKKGDDFLVRFTDRDGGLRGKIF